MDERFLKEEGSEIFTGNELVVKGALEAEVALITGYPGSPVSEIFDVAYRNRDLLKSHGILAELANNEALAVARVNGSRMAGVRAMAVMKSVGLHVAADGLALGNLAEPSNAGAGVIVVGDDPGMESTQINNDSRFLSEHLHMPILEPSTFQEIKDWVAVACELSSASDLYITYLLTTNQADGGGTVWAHPNRYPAVNTTSPVSIVTERIKLDRNVVLPPTTWAREASLPGRFNRLLADVRRRRLNELRWPAAPRARHAVGFVSSGTAYGYLEHALMELGLTGHFPVLKLGVTYPVDPEIVCKLARAVDAIYVVEEKRGFLENQIIRILHDARQSDPAGIWPAVYGKRFAGGTPGIPEARGLSASRVEMALLPVLLAVAQNDPQMDAARLRAEAEIMEATDQSELSLAPRTPTFCPGCPHRDSSSVLLEVKRDFMNASYMKRVHGRAAVDVVFHGETGCFSMLMFEPNTPLMHNYSGMGLGGGTGAGADPFITNKQVVFLGDSTFFHSGMIAISDSIKNNQDITYIILDNKTTAMTGHQPTPGTDGNIMGERTFAQSIEKIVTGMASQDIPVTAINPEDRDGYRALLEDTILDDGVKIIIADKECGLTYHRRLRRERQQELRRHDYLAREKHINITPEVCEFCLECTRLTGCPGLTIEQTAYGPKIATELTGCVSDGACAKTKACPAFEEVIVRRKAPPAQRRVLPNAQDLPPAAVRPLRGIWYGYTAGVGGMGAGLVSAILVSAAHRAGHRVLFTDKKGLAVRNGSVYAHIVLTSGGGALAPLVPYGKADLVIGIDLLESARSLDASSGLRVAHPGRTAAVVNTALHPTVRMLMGDDPLPGEAAEELLRRRTRAFWGGDVSAVAQRYFGSTVHANVMLLGAASQLGHLPVSAQHLEEAIAAVSPIADRKANADAFRLGRQLVATPELLPAPPSTLSYAVLLAQKSAILTATHGMDIARRYRFLVEEAVLHLAADDDLHRALAQRAYDLMQYDSLALAERYVGLVLRVAERDRRQWKMAATRAVVREAFHVMAIKDEIYVAHLLTSPEKRERDRARYGVNEANGDRLSYRHFNRPEFTLWGRSLRWDMVTRDWQLRMIKRCKFLRKLLPGWHRAEREFRDGYLQLVEQFEATSQSAYDLWVQILNTPSEVRGYREIRAPRMAQARETANALLRRLQQKGSPVTTDARW